MDRFAVLPAAEKVVYFEMAAASLNMSPELLKKDFWVCWTLKHIFTLDEIGAHITFKGGTSLSKCFDAIQRFSEDIDIAIERTYLEHERNIEPSLSESNKENKRRLKNLCPQLDSQSSTRSFQDCDRRWRVFWDMTAHGRLFWTAMIIFGKRSYLSSQSLSRKG